MRGCGHHARVQPPLGAPRPSPHRLLGAAIFLPRPSRGKSDVRLSLPAGARRKERAAAVVRRPQGRVAPGQRGGSEALSRGREVPGVAEASEERLRV